MRNFRKVLLVSIVFLLMCGVLAFGLAEVYIRSEYAYDEDVKLRRQLAGEIDYICLGASHVQQALIPSELDQTLGVNSYILAGGWQSVPISKILFNTELSRNPVKEVVIDFTCDTMNATDKDYTMERDLYVLPRFENDLERLSYICSNFNLRDDKDILIKYMQRSVEYLFKKAQGEKVDNVDYESKGFRGRASQDMRLKERAAVEKYNSGKVNNNWTQENIECLSDIIRTCHENNIKVTIAVMPVTQSKIWRLDGWDEFLRKLREFSKENDCKMVDFNLLKSRFILFSEETSFSNQDHLSEKGAKEFTPVFCQIMQQLDGGEDISNQFYDSYEEMKQHTIYAEMISKN